MPALSNDPGVWVGTTDLPFGAPVLDGPSVAYEVPGLLQKPRSAKAPVVPTLLPDRSAMFIESFFGDYFNKVYFIPSILNLIDPIIGAPNKFSIWNTHFSNVSITGVSSNNDQGITLDITLPVVLGGIKLTFEHVIVDDTAPNSEEAHYIFTLSAGADTPWTIILLRTNLLSVAPEVPLVETYKWKTVVDVARDGTEQRTTLTQFSRREQQIEWTFLEDVDISTIYEQLATQLQETFSLPLWAEGTRILADAASGASQILIDTTVFDVQEGDQLFFTDPYETLTESVKVDFIAGDGVTVHLLSGLLNPWTTQDGLYRVTTARIQDKPALDRPPFGFVSLKTTVRITEFRDLFDAGITAQEVVQDDVMMDRQVNGTVYTLSSIPILNCRPIVDDTTPESFDWGFDIMDYDVGTFTYFTDRLSSAPTYMRKYYSTKPVQQRYWNYLLNWMHGQRRPVWLPTFINDLGGQIFNISGSTIETVDSKFGSHYVNNSAYGGVFINYKNGFLPRRITNITINGEGRSVISLDTAVPGDFPDDGPYYVGFMILARQATDEVQREWHSFYNFLTTSFVGTKTTPEIT